jgi:hypothetical protein
LRSLLQQTLEREIRREKLVAELSKHDEYGSSDSKHIDQLANSLEPFLVSILNGLDVAIKFTKNPQFGRAIAFATGQVIEYCFDDEDLFPERDYGILGLLDDAYMVHRFVVVLYQTYPISSENMLGYSQPDERTFQLVRSLLPAGVCDALDRTCYNMVQVANALFTSGIRQNHIHSESPKPTLRVREAISFLASK